jgi:hypothetical protein
MRFLPWFAAFAFTATAASATITLRSSAWTITADPATLDVAARLPDGRILPISTAQPDLGDAANLSSNAASAHWQLPRAHLSVSLALADRRLTVQIATDRTGRFSWPVFGVPDPAIRYIVPYGEGLLVDPRDPVWQSRMSPRRLDSMENFSLPLWGVMGTGWTLTFLMRNPFDGAFLFTDTAPGLAWRFEHEFKRHWREKEFGFDIFLGPESPIEPARLYRRLLLDAGEFVSLSEKIARTPDARKLPGAAHAYLWSLGAIGPDDVRDWTTLARTLASSQAPAAVAVRTKAGTSIAGRFAQRRILAALDEFIRADPQPNAVTRRKAVVFETFPAAFVPPSQWGDGLSAKMFARMQAIGLDRMWLGVSGSTAFRGMPDAVAAAARAGYLLGPYDSYDSIHAPGEPDTWETAQFDRELFEKGAVVGADGRKVPGFRKKGYWLNSVAARPYVERRVSQTFAGYPFNSFFMDCDATGFLHDNYALAFVTTQADDMRERLSRMRWIVDLFHVPIGSEGGQWFAAPAIHFAHGMMTGSFGFGDPRFRDKSSPYFLGGYWPPDAPAIFLKPVPLPDDYRALYFDPRSRLPLFQTVFHDSVITTHHWSRPSLKFTNVARVNELMELLYNVPPLYHLNPEELEKRGPAIARHYRFFSPLHRETALLALDDFSWLTADRLVQRTTYGGKSEMVANFGGDVFVYQNVRISAGAILARHLGTGQVQVFVPATD